MGPHCTVRPELPFRMALTLEPIKMSMYSIYNAALPGLVIGGLVSVTFRGEFAVTSWEGPT